MMGRALFLLIVSASSIVCQGQSFSGDTWEKAQANRQGIITITYVETPAMAHRDGAGNLTGICMDIMNDFLHFVNTTKGVKLEVRMVGDGSSFKGMYDSVRMASGGVFGIGNITITEDRKKEVRFSPPYITNFAILITQSNVPMLTKMEDLPKSFANFTAYCPKGTLNDRRMAELKQHYFPTVKVAHTATGMEAITKLSADPSGFAYLDFVFYLQALQDGKPLRRHAIGDRPAEQFGFVMPLNSDWSPVLEEFFAANGGYKNSAEYKDILIRHLGETGAHLLQKAR